MNAPNENGPNETPLPKSPYWEFECSAEIVDRLRNALVLPTEQEKQEARRQASFFGEPVPSFDISEMQLKRHLVYNICDGLMSLAQKTAYLKQESLILTENDQLSQDFCEELTGWGALELKPDESAQFFADLLTELHKLIANQDLIGPWGRVSREGENLVLYPADTVLDVPNLDFDDD